MPLHLIDIVIGFSEPKKEDGNLQNIISTEQLHVFPLSGKQIAASPAFQRLVSKRIKKALS